MTYLIAMVANREYVVARYGVEMTATVSQVNALSASLEEIARKVSAEEQKVSSKTNTPSAPKIATSKVTV